MTQTQETITADLLEQAKARRKKSTNIGGVHLDLKYLAFHNGFNDVWRTRHPLDKAT